ncbi:MAG: ImmA/IrrE family metallo-endopeptidase [Bacteroidales bacterium]|nr:ImmA/IrrE family metallo-endopeptidase [Bacteroidales bacterium]MCF8338906.1 ImmA/IrrE family metallo-endopeptidase [Bacteroidales bacterium]
MGRFKGETDFRTIVDDIRSELNLNTEWAGNQPNWEKALDHLTQVIENKGIIVAFNGVVGNNTKRPIPVDECRGFVLVDDTAPFMFVNSRDSKAAQMFTIVHELGHIWTGQSAGFDFRQMQPAADPVEKLCDKIAAELLVPENTFNEQWLVTHDFKSLAKHFKVSPIVVARRALDTGKISKTAFFSFYNNYLEEVRNKKNRQEPGGDFYKTAKKRLSRSFLTHVDRAVRENYLLVRDAYHLTGLKGSTFRELMSNQLYY